MPKPFEKALDVYELACEKLGRLSGYLVLVIMILTTTEVLMRYILNRPTSFVWPLNRIFFGVFILFAGLYNMKNGLHIRIEILYDKLFGWPKLFVRLVALLSFVAFMGVLVWQTSWMGWNSFESRELMVGAFRVPLYPFKLLIPVACFLFLVEGIVVFIRKRD